MLSPNLIYLSLILGVLGYGRYIIDTYKGVTKPNRISWSLWALSAFVTLLSQKSLGSTRMLLYTAMQVILPLSIFLISFRNKHSYWKLNLFDYICGILSIIGLVLLFIIHAPLISLILGILSDLFASIPTVIKCYKDPESETWTTYLFAIFSSLLAVLSVKHFNFSDISFSFYVMLINILFVVLIKWPRNKI